MDEYLDGVRHELLEMQNANGTGRPNNGFTKNTYATGYEAIVWPCLTLPRIRRSATSHLASLLLTPTFFAFTVHSYTLSEFDVFHVLY